MLLEKYRQLLSRMDYYISVQQTGTPKTFSEKLDISVRTLHRYLDWFCDLGICILYCRRRETYYYEVPGNLKFQIFFEEK